MCTIKVEVLSPVVCVLLTLLDGDGQIPRHSLLPGLLSHQQCVRVSVFISYICNFVSLYLQFFITFMYFVLGVGKACM